MFLSKKCDKTSAAFDSFLRLTFQCEYKPATKSVVRAWHVPWNIRLSLDTSEDFRLICILENIRIIKRKNSERASKVELSVYTPRRHKEADM